MRIKGALNLAFRSLVCTLLAGWWGSKLRTKDKEGLEWRGRSGNSEELPEGRPH